MHISHYPTSNSGGRIRTSDLRVMSAISSKSGTFCEISNLWSPRRLQQRAHGRQEYHVCHVFQSVVYAPVYARRTKPRRVRTMFSTSLCARIAWHMVQPGSISSNSPNLLTRFLMPFIFRVHSVSGGARPLRRGSAEKIHHLPIL
jgi:hypothetical protein